MTTQTDCSIGISAESTWGTTVAPALFLEFLSETLDVDLTMTQGKGLRVGGILPRASRRVLSQLDPKGNIVLEAPVKGLGLLLQAALGSLTNTAVPAQSGAFQQVHTPTTTDPLASYTIQKGIPPVGGGATHPITFAGMVCASIEFSLKGGDTLEVTTEWMGKDISTSVSYTAPAYPTLAQDGVFHYAAGALALGGTVVAPTTTALASGGTAAANVTDFSLKWDNGLDKKGFNLGGAGKRTRKPAIGVRSLTGKITAEYSDAVLRDAYLNQTSLALLLTLTNPLTIGSSITPALQLYVPAIKLEGSIPASNGGDVITIAPSFTGLDTGASAPFTVVYRTSDTAP